LCSDDTEFELNKWKFYARLKKRGYPEKFLKRIFNKKYNREKLLHKYTQAHTNVYKQQTRHIAALRIPLNGFNKKLLSIVKESLKFPQELREDIHFTDIFGERRSPMIIYETAQNVTELLIRAECYRK
jgi:hypothetical protein